MLAFGETVLFRSALREIGYDAHLFGRFTGPKACFLALAWELTLVGLAFVSFSCSGFTL